ncbi:DUF6894 family protein [Methylobacterium haplocladii]
MPRYFFDKANGCSDIGSEGVMLEDAEATRRSAIGVALDAAAFSPPIDGEPPAVVTVRDNSGLMIQTVWHRGARAGSYLSHRCLRPPGANRRQRSERTLLLLARDHARPSQPAPSGSCSEASSPLGWPLCVRRRRGWRRPVRDGRPALSLVSC